MQSEGTKSKSGRAHTKMLIVAFSQWWDYNSSFLLGYVYVILKDSVMNMNSGWGWRVTVLLVCFLRTTAPLVTTLPIQKPHQWWGGGSPGTHGMTNPSWPSRPTSSVLQTSLLSGPNRWSSLHHSLPGCWRKEQKLRKHPAGKTNGSRSHWPISMKAAPRKCLSQRPTANDQLFFLLLGGQNYWISYLSSIS